MKKNIGDFVVILQNILQGNKCLQEEVGNFRVKIVME